MKTIEQVKALGAPFRAAEVQVSLLERVARFVVVIGHGNNPAIDLPVRGNPNDFREVVSEITAAAMEMGLIHENSIVAGTDLDALQGLTSQEGVN